MGIDQLATSASAWKPLWGDAPPREAEATLQDIASTLRTPLEDPGLAGGTTGLALLHAYLERGRPGAGHGACASELLDHAIEALGNQVTGPGFYAGFSGIAWAVDHLRGIGGPDEDANEAIDEALIEFLNVPRWGLDYDLVSGLVGYGVYALGRLDRPTGRALALRVLDHLEALKVPVEDGWTWATAPELLPAWQRVGSPSGYYNLGLAHGMPGVVALLGHALAQGFAPERCRPLLEGALRWMRGQRRPEGFGACFAAATNIGEPGEPSPTRISWCYGDLGLSVAWLIAARGAGNPAWEAEALEVARLCTRRPPPEGAADACLCHGFAGNAHLYNRLWQATGEAVFAEAARAWMEVALRFRKPGEGIAGFRAYMPGLTGREDPWEDAKGLLEGATGVGLALAAALDPVVPAWDRMLLVDIPGRHDVQISEA